MVWLQLCIHAAVKLHQPAVVDVEDSLIGQPIHLLEEVYRILTAELAGKGGARLVVAVDFRGDVRQAHPVAGAALHPVRHPAVDTRPGGQTQQQRGAEHARQRQGGNGARARLAAAHGSTHLSTTVISGMMLEAKIS